MTAFARILLTGGGTAGHVNPALAIGRALGDERSTYLYVGVRGRAEATVVPREGLPISFVRASAFPGARPSLAWIPFLFNVAAGTLKALYLVGRFHPDIIVGTGGFASAPVMLAAGLLRRLGWLKARVYVHEQNAAPGKLNLLVGRLADRVFVSFPETVSVFPGNGVLTGYPLRDRIQAASCGGDHGVLDLTVPEGRQVVFAFGGSQGARTINRAVVDALAELLPYRDRVFIIHGTGLRPPGSGYDPGRETEERLDRQYSEAERRLIETFYVRRPYFHDIEHVYALSNLTVVRGGAGTLSEVAALGLPAIVVPKINLSGEHQVMNARALARCGGAVVLYEETRLVDGALVEELDGRVLAGTILSLLNDTSRLAAMAESAKRFVRGRALDVIRRYVSSDVTGEVANVAETDVPSAEVPLLSNGALLSRLDRAHTHARGGYRAEAEIPSRDDRAYYVSRAASLLASASWESRNLGVKLVGLLQAREKLPLILAILTDRRPAPLYARLLGGDFQQVGFVRRNALTALARLGVVTDEVETVLLASLSDPYFEARAEAARTIAVFDTMLSATARTRMVSGLIARLGNRWVEVAAAAAEALGHVGDETSALTALLGLQDHRQWIVRSAGLRGLRHLVERGKAGNLDELERRVRGYVLTATDFRPEFQIKTSFVRVLDAIATRRAQAS